METIANPQPLKRYKKEELPIQFTKEDEACLLARWFDRVKTHNITGKARIKAQSDFFIGAFMMIDTLNAIRLNCSLGQIDSSITPLIFFSILRGDDLTEEKLVKNTK